MVKQSGREKFVFGRGRFFVKSRRPFISLWARYFFCKKRALISQGSSDLQSAIETLSRNKGD